MSTIFGDPCPILCHDFLLCCKTSVFLNLQMNECKAWLLCELEEKGLIEIKKKFLIFHSYTLTQEGVRTCTFLAERLN